MLPLPATSAAPGGKVRATPARARRSHVSGARRRPLSAAQDVGHALRIHVLLEHRELAVTEHEQEVVLVGVELPGDVPARECASTATRSPSAVMRIDRELDALREDLVDLAGGGLGSARCVNLPEMSVRPMVCR